VASLNPLALVGLGGRLRLPETAGRWVPITPELGTCHPCSLSAPQNRR
jgi:hypothetical protein